MGRAWINRANGANWEPFEANAKGVKHSTGWLQNGDYYILRSITEDPPGTLNYNWELVDTRVPQIIPTPFSVRTDPVSPPPLDPCGFAAAWTVPTTLPATGYDVRVRIYNATRGTNYTKTTASTGGSVSWTAAELGNNWYPSDNVYALFSYVNAVGAGATACMATTYGTCP